MNVQNSLSDEYSKVTKKTLKRTFFTIFMKNRTVYIQTSTVFNNTVLNQKSVDNN